MKIIIILLISFVIFLNIANANECDFGLCNVHSDIIGNTDKSTKLIIISLIKYFLSFLALISIIFVFKGGFQIMSAAGDDEKLKSGKKTILFALLGVFLIIIAYFFVATGFYIGKESK